MARRYKVNSRKSTFTRNLRFRRPVSKARALKWARREFTRFLSGYKPVFDLWVVEGLLRYTQLGPEGQQELCRTVLNEALDAGLIERVTDPTIVAESLRDGWIRSDQEVYRRTPRGYRKLLAAYRMSLRLAAFRDARD